MNAPHIGRTLTHSRAIAAYRNTSHLPADFQHELDRSERNDVLLAQPHPVTFVAPVDEPMLPTWREAIKAALYDFALPLALLTVWGLVIFATWLLAPAMTGFGETFMRVFGGVK